MASFKARPLPLTVINGYTAKPCLGCGYCCKTAPCPIAARKYRDKWVSPCPSLRQKGDRYYCGEVEDAPTEREKQRLILILSIGAGCSSTLTSDYRRMEKKIAMGQNNRNSNEWFRVYCMARPERPGVENIIYKSLRYYNKDEAMIDALEHVMQSRHHKIMVVDDGDLAVFLSMDGSISYPRDYQASQELGILDGLLTNLRNKVALTKKASASESP